MSRATRILAPALLTFYLLLGCSREKLYIPSGIIPPDTMSMVIADLHITEAMLAKKYQRRDSLEMFKPAYFSALFTKYHTTEETFRESYHFYQEHPKTLESIYEESVTKLNMMNGEKEE